MSRMNRITAAIVLSLVGTTLIHTQVLAQKTPEAAETNAAPTGKLVGSLGDSAHITFEGNTTFTAAELRTGLKNASAFVVDSHPEAPLEAFLSRISTSLEKGYQQGGFPESKTRARINAEGTGIHVVIQEGRRVRNGELSIEGVDATLAAILRTGLTEDRQVPNQLLLKQITTKTVKAQWKPNEPTNCHDAAERWLQMETSQLLIEEGWFAAEVDARIEMNKEGASATIIVKSLGPGSVIETIRVTGAKRNSKSEVLEFLELRRGMKITNNLLNDSRRRLYESGRFLKSSIAITRKTPLSMEVDLDINVIEAKHIPPLSNPFSREMQAMLKAGQWLANSQTSDYDVVLSGTSTDLFAFHAALSGRDGLLLALRFAQEGAAADPMKLIAEPADVIFIVSSSQLILQVAGVEGLWRYEIKLPVEAKLALGSTGDPEKPFSFSAGIHTSTSFSEKQALPLALTIDPVVIAGTYITEAMNRAEAEWKGDQVVWTSTNVTLSVNASTGRLIGMTKSAVKEPFSIKTERGGFERLRKRLAPDATRVNRYSAEAPLSSSAAFYTEALAQLSTRARILDTKGQLPPPATIAETAEAFQALLKIGVLAPFDEIVKKANLAKNATVHSPFTVPYEEDAEMPENLILLMIAQLANVIQDALPKNSWADPLFTEMVHVAHGNTRYTKPVLDALYEDTANTGPIAYLVMAKVLNLMGPQESTRFAQQGLQHLSTGDFQRDWQPFVKDPGAEQLFNEFIAEVPTLDARHQATLDTIFGENATARATEYLNQLDKESGPSFGTFMEPGMAHLWESTIRAEVEKQLKSIDNPATEPDYQVATVNGVALSRRALTPWMGNKQLSPAQAREIAINAEAVYQYYHTQNSQQTQALIDKLMTEQAPVASMLEAAGTPSDFVKKTLLYQEVMGRQISNIPPPTEADVQAYYNKHSAAINKPFDEVKAQLAISLTQSRGSVHIEQWVRVIRQGCAIRLLKLEAPAAE